MLPQLDPRTAGLAISAIAATQTAAAQSIIGQLYSDLTQPLANRKSAAWAMIQVEQPTPEVVSAFAAAVRSATAHGPDVAAGILALGTMLGRTDPATQQLAMATLLDLESTAHANGATVNWLEALGNSGMPAALEAARRFHNHENVGIRVAAVSAVRAVEGAAALAVAVAALQDPTAAVRIRAAQVVIGRAEPQAGNVINAFLLNEPNRFVRGSVLEALAGRLPDPNALALIQRSANSDPDAEVRQLATRMLP